MGANLIKEKPTKELEWAMLALFRSMVKDDSDRLDIEKVSRAFEWWGISSEYGRELISACDHNGDGIVEFEEFLAYFSEKEGKIRSMFNRLDAGDYGHLTVGELEQALVKQGVVVSPAELRNFINHVDRDNNGIVTYDEWRDFLILSPLLPSLESVYHKYSKIVHIDIGEDVIIPTGITRSHTWKFFCAGAIAGTTSRSLTAPLDRLKVLMQVESSGKYNSKYSNSVIQGLRTIYVEGGIKGFYRGNGVNVAKIAPESAIKFYAYEEVKRLFNSSSDNTDGLSMMGRNLCSGGIAGLISQTAIYPMEVMKTRLITQMPQKTFIKTFSDILKCEGPSAFFRGIGPSAIGIVPYAAIDLTVYDFLKRYLTNLVENPGTAFDFNAIDSINNNNYKTTPNVFISLLSGTISSTLGSTCVYPLSLVRTRLQAHPISNSLCNPGGNSNGDIVEYKNAIDVFRKTYAKEGIGGFYKGLKPNLLKVVPAVSVSYVVYEYSKTALLNM